MLFLCSAGFHDVYKLLTEVDILCFYNIFQNKIIKAAFKNVRNIDKRFNRRMGICGFDIGNMLRRYTDFFSESLLRHMFLKS